MSSLLWYSNVNGPWASKPRFWSLRSQTEPFFTTRVENYTLPIIWEFLWNHSDTNHFLCIDVISIWRLYLPGVEPGISRWLVSISTARPWMLSSADESIHGVAVGIPINHREIPGSTPGRYNLQIEIASTSWILADEVCAVWYSSGLPRSSQ